MIINKNNQLQKSNESVQIAQLKKQVEALTASVASAQAAISALSSSFDTDTLTANTITSEEENTEALTATEASIATGNIVTLSSEEATLTDASIETATINQFTSDEATIDQLTANTIDAEGINVSNTLTADEANIDQIDSSNVTTENLGAFSESYFAGTATFDAEAIHNNDIYFPLLDTKIYGEHLEIDADKIKAKTIEGDLELEDLSVRDLQVRGLLDKKPAISHQAVGFDNRGNIIPIEISEKAYSSKWSEGSDGLIEPDYIFKGIKNYGRTDFGCISIDDGGWGIGPYESLKNNVLDTVVSDLTSFYVTKDMLKEGALHEISSGEMNGKLYIPEINPKKIRIVALYEVNTEGYPITSLSGTFEQNIVDTATSKYNRIESVIDYRSVLDQYEYEKFEVGNTPVIYRADDETIYQYLDGEYTAITELEGNYYTAQVWELSLRVDTSTIINSPKSSYWLSTDNGVLDSSYKASIYLNTTEISSSLFDKFDTIEKVYNSFPWFGQFTSKDELPNATLMARWIPTGSVFALVNNVCYAWVGGEQDWFEYPYSPTGSRIHVILSAPSEQKIIEFKELYNLPTIFDSDGNYPSEGQVLKYSDGKIIWSD